MVCIYSHLIVLSFSSQTIATVLPSITTQVWGPEALKVYASQSIPFKYHHYCISTSKVLFITKNHYNTFYGPCNSPIMISFSFSNVLWWNWMMLPVVISQLSLYFIQFSNFLSYFFTKLSVPLHMAILYALQASRFLLAMFRHKFVRELCRETASVRHLVYVQGSCWGPCAMLNRRYYLCICRFS